MREITLEQAAEMAHQAEVICLLAEDTPHQLDQADIEAIFSLLRALTGKVAGCLINEVANQEAGNA